MFIHLGGNKMIRVSEVVAILDAGIRRSSAPLAPFLEDERNRARIEKVSSHEEIKSYVVTEKAVYASPISSLTLMKRAHPLGNRLQGVSAERESKKERKE
ncbi:DUF370 domain-containing protein [Marinithermofilum abyssi]|uniref:DUF370 domain-containing protein n=1 Tax=Marinithermofilum abyssi TaxID=1571185 RepID=A0A8J2VG09_9BACL|nr:extracellular matrix/biofilm biosynthesis regulator RemA family protein [Marinithermofilum abyssi]GGE06187.1 DUF370 domain-containing protein [Marinithermofilum abyssi]